MFLTRSQLIALTSYKQPTRQIRWLVEHNFAFEVGGDGRPRVLASHIVRVLEGTAQDRITQPDVEGLREFLTGRTG